MKMFISLDIESWTMKDFRNDFFNENTIYLDKSDTLSGIAFVDVIWVFDEEVITFSDNLLSVLFNTTGALYSIQFDNKNEGNLFAKEPENFYKIQFSLKHNIIFIKYNDHNVQQVEYKIFVEELQRFSRYSFATIEYCYQEIVKNKNYIGLKNVIEQKLTQLIDG